MNWSSATTVNIKYNWQFTEPVLGDIFRLTHISAPPGGAFIVAQSQLSPDDSIDLFDLRYFTSSEIPESVIFIPPAHFSERRLSFKQVPPTLTLEQELRRLLSSRLFLNSATSFFPNQRSSWQIQLEVNDMSLTHSSSASASNTSSATTPRSINLSSDADIVLLEANQNRKGGTLWNSSAFPLYLEFGAVVVENNGYGNQRRYALKVGPNGYCEIPFGYTGVLHGYSDENATGTILVREFI